MRLNNFATYTSAALLATSIFIWRDLFFFSKTAHLPAWTAVLPSPINTPLYLAFFCLLAAQSWTTLERRWLRADAQLVRMSLRPAAPNPEVAVHTSPQVVVAASAIGLFNYARVSPDPSLEPVPSLLRLQSSNVERLLTSLTGGRFWPIPAEPRKALSA
jgi:hypothetical protein